MTADEVTDEFFGELCDLFWQAWCQEEAPNTAEDRIRHTSSVSRRYAMAVEELWLHSTITRADLLESLDVSAE